MFSLFEARIAYRLAKTASHERTLSTMIKLCFSSMLLGAAALTMVVAIMNGLHSATFKSIQGVHADLMIRSRTPLNYPKIKTVIEKEFPEVSALSPLSALHAALDFTTEPASTTVVFITGIDPTSFTHVSSLQQTIIEPAGATLQDLVKENHVLIGKELAHAYHLTVGSSLPVLYPAPTHHRRQKVALEQTHFVVGGIFASGVDEVDAQGIFAHHELLYDLTGSEGVTEITIKLAEGSDQEKLQKKLEARLGLTVISWQDLYPALLAALKLEKYGMLIILSLVVALASVNTLSLIFMFMTHKRRTLAILLAHGMSKKSVQRSCLLVGLGVTGAAATVGIAVGSLASLALDYYQLIPLPDVYYVTHLPAELDAFSLGAIWLFTVVLGAVTSWYPVRTLEKKQITHILKFEL